MPRPKNKFLLTDREMDVMHVLWKSDKPLVASEITHINKSLNINTVQAALRKLLKQKFIDVSDIVYSGTVLTRSYEPVISQNDLLAKQLVHQYKRKNEEVSIPNLVATLLENEKNEKQMIDDLEKILEERREMLGKEEE